MGQLHDLERGTVSVNLLTGQLFVKNSENQYKIAATGGWGKRCSSLVSCADYCESSSDDKLVVTIETTRDCNFACLYCYQNDRKTKVRITESTLDLAVAYMADAIAAAAKNGVLVRLIGGEPLLARDEILYLLRGIRGRGINAEFYVDTNGRVPIQWFLDEGFPCDLTICLSMPLDHNRLRYSSGRDSASAIYDNVSKLVLSGEQSVGIAYNVHDKNMDQFSDFLRWIEPLRNRPVCRVSTAVIDNYDFNLANFESCLSYSEYSRWHTETAIPEMIKHGWSVPVRRVGSPKLCQGHQPYSCKIYAGGEVTICDAMQINDARLTIEELARDVERLNSVYRDIKQVDPWKTEGCIGCVSRIVCFGRKWCESASCEPQLYNHVLNSNKAVTEAHLEGLL